jgi:hypothetical protein
VEVGEELGDAEAGWEGGEEGELEVGGGEVRLGVMVEGSGRVVDLVVVDVVMGVGIEFVEGDTGWHPGV